MNNHSYQWYYFPQPYEDILKMRIGVRVSVLFIIGIIVYSLLNVSFIRPERINDSILQKPEELEAFQRLKRIEDEVHEIGEFVLIKTNSSSYLRFNLMF